MGKLKSAFEFLAPTTSVGFLSYGWLGGIFASNIGALAVAVTGTWFLGIAVVFIIYVPLYIRAVRLREQQREEARQAYVRHTETAE